MKKLTTTAVLALLSAAFLTTSASAVSFSAGDLILSFRDGTETSTSAENLEFDLGSAASFNYSANNLDVVNLETDLDNVFGNGSLGSFTSDSSLVFSLSASNSTGNHEIWYSDPQDANAPVSLGNNTTASGNIGHLYTTFTTGTGVTVESDNAVEVIASKSTSYSSAIRNVDKSYNPTNSTFSHDFNFVTGFNSEDSVTDPIGVTLIQQTNQGVPDALGTFTVLSDGVLAYTVPEPSTYALMGLAGLAILVARRRMINV